MKKKARQILYLPVDFDGVLTDGTFYYLENGEEMKKLSAIDLLGASAKQKEKCLIDKVFSGKSLLLPI